MSDKMGTSAEADFQSWLEMGFPGDELGQEQIHALRVSFFGGVWVGIQVQKYRPEKAARYEDEVRALAKNMMSVGALDKARGIDEGE